MKGNGIIFFITILVVFLCSRISMKNLQKPDVVIPDPSSEIQFIIDMNQENAKNDEVAFNDKGYDFFGFAKDCERGQRQKEIELNLREKISSIRKFLDNNGLWEKGFSNPATYTFSTTDKFASTSVDYFRNYIKELFDPEGLQTIYLSSKTLLENNRDELIGQTTEDPKWKFDLILLSYGFYRKTSGLSLTPNNCSNLMDELKKRWMNKVDEYKTFLAINDFTDLLRKISDSYVDKNFVGNSQNGAWIYTGKERALLNSGLDLYNFLKTVLFDDLHHKEIKEIPEADWQKLLELNSKFILNYLDGNDEFVGKRFFAFLLDLINRRSYVTENPLSNEKLQLKKWLSIGVGNTPFVYLYNYLKNHFKIHLNGNSVYFAFCGPTENKITHINVYNNELQLVGKIDIADLLQFAQVNLSDNEEFNKRCIGKPFVEDFDADY